jgi:hypothetical protein
LTLVREQEIEVRGQMTEDRRQKSEISDQKSEVRSWEFGVIGRRSIFYSS